VYGSPQRKQGAACNRKLTPRWRVGLPSSLNFLLAQRRLAKLAAVRWEAAALWVDELACNCVKAVRNTLIRCVTTASAWALVRPVLAEGVTAPD